MYNQEHLSPHTMSTWKKNRGVFNRSIGRNTEYNSQIRHLTWYKSQKSIIMDRLMHIKTNPFRKSDLFSLPLCHKTELHERYRSD